MTYGPPTDGRPIGPLGASPPMSGGLVVGQAAAPANRDCEVTSRRHSFVERFVIGRAHTFTKGNEKAEAWEAMLTAASIYEMIFGHEKMVDRVGQESTSQGMRDAQPPALQQKSEIWREKQMHNYNKYIEGLEKQLMNEGPASQLAQQYVEAIESGSKSMIQKCKDAISKIGGGNGPRT